MVIWGKGLAHSPVTHGTAACYRFGVSIGMTHVCQGGRGSIKPSRSQGTSTGHLWGSPHHSIRPVEHKGQTLLHHDRQGCGCGPDPSLHLSGGNKRYRNPF